MPDNEQERGGKRPFTEPYRGVRDFYPEDMFVQNYLFETMRSVTQRFGYVEYGASIMESAELYEAKSNPDIVENEMYTFTDRGDRRVSLRPEMTPTVARMIARKRKELSFPLRWYSLPNVFRYERPQRGRLREHWQLNADVFGVAGIGAEVEIILLAYTLMRSFGAKEGDFEIRVNDRANLLSSLEDSGIRDEKQRKFLRLLDRKAKMTEAEFTEAAQAIVEPTQLAAYREKAERFAETIEQKHGILERLHNVGIANARIEPELVRGFDYYTGIVFEVFDTDPENRRSLFGGGRYDNLLEVFGVEPVPAVGFGMGDVTLRDFLETRNLLPEYHTSTSLFICTTDTEKTAAAHELAAALRAEGIAVAVNITEKKVGDQISLADRRGIPYVLVIGDSEIARERYPLKNLESGAEQQLSVDELVSFFSDTQPVTHGE